jgi:hypothetical protein
VKKRWFWLGVTASFWMVTVYLRVTHSEISPQGVPLTLLWIVAHDIMAGACAYQLALIHKDREIVRLAKAKDDYYLSRVSSFKEEVDEILSDETAEDPPQV